METRNELGIVTTIDGKSGCCSGRKCAICECDIQHDLAYKKDPVLENGFNFIRILSSAFKISETSVQSVTNSEDLSNLKGPLSCGNCEGKIKEMCSILQEIDKLTLQYRVIFDAVNSKIAKSYFRKQSTANCETAQAEQGMKEQVCPNNDAVIKKIRIMLLQCFSGWKVIVPKLDSSKQQPITAARHSVNRRRKLTFSSHSTTDIDQKNIVIPRTRRRKVVDPQEVQAELEEAIGIADTVSPDESNEAPMDEDKHFSDSQPDTEVRCLECDKTFKSEKNLRIHEVIVHKRPNRHRPKTPKRLQLLNNSEHCVGVPLKTTLKDETFHCSKCNKTFKKSANVDSEGKYSIVCDMFGCKKAYKAFNVFRKHHLATCQSTVFGDLTHCCEFCGRRCFSSHTLQAHIVSCHTKKFPFYCEVCGVGRATKGDLAAHMLCHTDEKKFQCQLCPESFKRKTRFTIHMRRHTNVCPFVCDICGKQYCEQQRLTKHKAVHSNEKKFPCNICGKLFASKNYVYNHVRFTHQKFKKGTVNEATSPVEETPMLESVTVSQDQPVVEWISTSQSQEDSVLSLPNNVNVKQITLQQMPEGDSYFVEYTVEVESSNLAIL